MLLVQLVTVTMLVELSLQTEIMGTQSYIALQQQYCGIFPYLFSELFV